MKSELKNNQQQFKKCDIKRNLTVRNAIIGLGLIVMLGLGVKQAIAANQNYASANEFENQAQALYEAENNFSLNENYEQAYQISNQRVQKLCEANTSRENGNEAVRGSVLGGMWATSLGLALANNVIKKKEETLEKELGSN